MNNVGRTMFVVGVVISLIGLAVCLSYNFPLEKRELEKSYAGISTYKYNVTGFFNSGERLFVELPSIKKQYVPVPFNVTIFCPNNGAVIFRVIFEGDVTLGIIRYNYTLLINQGSLEVEEGVLGGIAKQTGNYTAELSRESCLLYGDPPKRLALQKEVMRVIIEYPYRKFFPAGIALFFVGSVLSLLTFKIGKTVRRVGYRKPTKISN